jgi:hypothetical protein
MTQLVHERERVVERRLTEKRLLELLSMGMSRSEACRLSGMSRGSFYYWMRRSPAFRASVLEARIGATHTFDHGGVQSCGDCGLVLSATAMFCRRCGSPQYVRPRRRRNLRPVGPGLRHDRTASVSLPEWAGILILAVVISLFFTFLFLLPGA